MLRPLTPSPTAVMVPAPSWPRTAGSAIGRVPFTTERSEWQTPEAPICRRTSPDCGSATSTSTISSGAPTAVAIAALVMTDSWKGWRRAPGNLVERAAAAVFPFGGPHPVAQHDRDRQHHERDREADDGHDHRGTGEGGGRPDEERPDPNEQGRVPDALGGLRPGRDARPAHQHGVGFHAG